VGLIYIIYVVVVIAALRYNLGPFTFVALRQSGVQGWSATFSLCYVSVTGGVSVVRKAT